MTWKAEIQATERHVLTKDGEVVATCDSAERAERFAGMLNERDARAEQRRRAEAQAASAKGVANVREHAGGWGVFIDRGGIPSADPTSHFQGRNAQELAERTAASYNEG